MIAALAILRDGQAMHAPDVAVSPETAPALGMEWVDLHWEHEGGGIKLATARAAHRHWDEWQALVAAEVNRVLAIPGYLERMAEDARRQAESDAEWRRLVQRAHARWDAEDAHR